MAPLNVADSVTKTTVISDAWLVADAAALESATSGELEEIAVAALDETVAGWSEFEAAGGGPVAVTWTVVMTVVEIWIVVAAPG